MSFICPVNFLLNTSLQPKRCAQRDFVAMAAYGDYGPGYIGTEIAYSQGGYETGPVSRVAPEVESVLMNAMKQLLEVQNEIDK